MRVTILIFLLVFTVPLVTEFYVYNDNLHIFEITFFMLWSLLCHNK